MISVIIPTLNEASSIQATLQSLTPFAGTIEVLIADGGSTDDTTAIAAAFDGVRCLQAPPGRAAQMNAGAQQAQGDILLFLHADTQLSGAWIEAVERAVSRSDFSIGAFRLKLNGQRFGYRIIEFGVYWRSRLWKLPYGDQALFVRKTDFLRDGGYPEIPLMEDVELVKRYRSQGRLTLLRLHATSSPRNWERDGLLKRTLTNWKTYRTYVRSQSATVADKIYNHRDRALILFCKEPVPGRVKTRLAATVGDDVACDIYREMVVKTLDSAREAVPSRDIYVFHDPPSAGSYMRDWLGGDYNYVAQCDGDLGKRMLHAFQYVHDKGHTRTAIIGTDCPSLQATHIRRAFETIARVDVCFGPTSDGGYYLIAARAPHEELFTGINWSTNTVLEESLKAAERCSLKTDLLEQLRDLDTEEDLTHHRNTGSIPHSLRAVQATR